MSASFMTPEDKKKSDEELQALVSGKPILDPATGAPLTAEQRSGRLFNNFITERLRRDVYEARKASEQRERLRPQNAQEEQASRQRAYAAYDRLDDDESLGLGGRRRASAYLTKTLGGA